MHVHRPMLGRASDNVAYRDAERLSALDEHAARDLLAGAVIALALMLAAMLIIRRGARRHSAHDA